MSDIPEDIYKPHARNINAGLSVLILTADKTEDQEFFYPYYRLIEEGFSVDVATPDGGAFKGKFGSGLKDTMKIGDVDSSRYQLLYIPGGKAPAALKKEEKALAIVRAFVETGRPVAAICHGPQLLAEAGVIQGKRISAWPEVQKEVEAAGAIYVSEEALTDGQFVTGRWPADLPAFVKAVLEQVRNARSVSGSSFRSAA